MPSLVRSTDWFEATGKIHHHIFYLDEVAGAGESSVSENHTHEIVWHPPIEAQNDEQGNLIQEAQDGYFEVMPDPEDGHTHDPLEEYPSKEITDDREESEIINEALELWDSAHEIEGDSQEKAEESESFYFGDGQWEEDVRNKLKAEGRACLTINHVGPKIDEISGHQRDNRTDISFTPVEGGDQVGCDIANIVWKVIAENSNYGWEESKAFKDAVIRGRGWLTLLLDTSKNLFGDLMVRRFNPAMIHCGEHEDEFLSDLEYLTKDRMYSMARLKASWPDVADEIEKDYQSWSSLTPSEPVTQYKFNHYAKADESTARTAIMRGDNYMMVDVEKKEYRVIEVWRRRWIDASVAARFENEFVQSMVGWRGEDIKQIKTMQSVKLVQRTEQKIEITKVAGGVLLSHEFPAKVPRDDFNDFAIYCYKRGNKFQGKVEFVKDVQREINKRRSQAVDIGNRMCSDITFYDESTFVDEKDLKDYLDNRSTPGAAIRVQDVDRKPSKNEMGEFPAAFVQLATIATEDLDRILNISPRDPGANTSAAAILQATKQKLIGNEFLFDSLLYMKKQLGRAALVAMQDNYSAQRVYEIVAAENSKNPNKPVTLGGEIFATYSRDEIEAVWDDMDFSKVDVAITESQYSPTRRMVVYLLLQEAMRNGVRISPKTLIRYMEAPETEKQQALQDLEEEAAAASAASQATQEMEEGKALIAKGIIPEKIKQKWGLAQPVQNGEPSAVAPTSNGAAPTGGIAQ